MTAKKKKRLFFMFLTIAGLIVAIIATFWAYQNRGLPTAIILLENGQVSQVRFDDLTMASFEAPPAGSGEYEIWLENGQVAEIPIQLKIGESVVVTIDSLYTKGLSVGVLKEDLLFTSYGLNANDGTFTTGYYGTLGGVINLRLYVAAKGHGATHFWVRIDGPTSQ
jgi:hypothetical protein